MGHALHCVRAVAVGLILGVATLSAGVLAQPAAQEGGQPPEDGINQIRLTEAQVMSFIAAQPDLVDVLPKLQKADDTPDAALEAELDGIAKKHGFSDFSELDDVAANISLVMSGLDTQSGQFTDPVEALKKELEEVQADASIPDGDKKQLVDELSEAIKTTPSLQHPENVDLVKAHRSEIERALD